MFKIVHIRLSSLISKILKTLSGRFGQHTDCQCNYTVCNWPLDLTGLTGQILGYVMWLLGKISTVSFLCDNYDPIVNVKMNLEASIF